MLGGKKILMTLVAALVTSLALAGPSGGGGGGGNGIGGGGGTGGGGGSGGGKPGSSVDEFYGDMALVDRDVNGVPILEWGLGPKDKWTWVRAPIVFPERLDTGEAPDGCPLTDTYLDELAADPDSDYVQLGTGSIYAHLGVEAYRVPFVDGEIPEEYAGCVTESDFGRLSVVRSPPRVMDAALLELVTTLNIEGAEINLDEAGRLMVSFEEDSLEILKTIDAPRENVAGFERLLETAGLSHSEVNGGATVELPVYPEHTGHAEAEALHFLDRAAAMLGGAADKFHPMGLDELMYTVVTMNIGSDMTPIAEDTFGLPNIGQEDKETFYYFNFSKFEYDRAATYAGDVCYLKVGTIYDTDPVSADVEVVREPILEVIFPALPEGDEYPAGGFHAGSGDGFDYTGFIGDNAWGFAQAVDDARAVILWVHEHPVPLELAEYCEPAVE